MFGTRTRAVGIAELRAFMEGLLGAAGCDRATASALADVHMEADLRGVGVQGLNHLVNSHVPHIREGRVKPSGKPTLVQEGPAFAVLDGNSGPGPIACKRAAEIAIDKAKVSGVAGVGVRNSHDFYMAGYYADLIARAGLVGMVYSDDIGPVVHAIGGAEPVIGSNPMAMAVPTEGEPVVVDFAPCATLPTHVRYAKRYGGQVAPGVTHDARGRPTTNPHDITPREPYTPTLGAIAPDGHKGYGLLLMIDFLSGALMGCHMGVDHTRPGTKKGHFLMAVNPMQFGSADTFRAAVSRRIAEVKGSRPAEDAGSIRVPGERSAAARAASLESGRVQVDAICWEDAVKLAAELGVPAPK